MSHIIPGFLDPVPLTGAPARSLSLACFKETLLLSVEGGSAQGSGSTSHRWLHPHTLYFIAFSLKGNGLGLQPLVMANIKIGIHIE